MSVPSQFPPAHMDSPRQRVVFSRQAQSLAHQRVLSTQTLLQAAHHRSRRWDDDSLFRILDDLNDRPVDPIYQDAVLTASARKHGKVATIFLRIIIVLICAAIGMSGVMVVEQLHKNSRRRVRMELASQVSRTAEREEKLKNDVAQLEQKVRTQSSRLPVQGVKTSDSEELMNGTSAVRGKGIRITIEAARGDTARSAARTGIAAPNTFTDTDLQQLTNILWANDAEAISINNRRIGMMTSIRTAGSSILIGLESLNAPYTITVIGDSAQLISALTSTRGKQYCQSLQARGLKVSVVIDNSITMNAVSSSQKTTFAKLPDQYRSSESGTDKK
jgi:uncharacterized protein YlxW (UPF0749 family)